MTWKSFVNSKFGLAALFSIFLFSGYLLGTELYKRYLIERQIENLKNQFISLQSGNSRLESLLGYLNSPDFQEKEIRRKLNLQKAGEHAVVLPEDNPNASSAVLEQEQNPPQAAGWKSWWKYFFGVETN